MTNTRMFGFRGEWTILVAVVFFLIAFFGSLFLGFWAITYVLDMFFAPATIAAFNNAAVAATVLLA